MVSWSKFKDHLLKNELHLTKNRLELMARTIRSNPTSPFILPEPTFGTTLIFSIFGPKMDLRFLHFPTSLQVKRPSPQRTKDAHGPSLHIRFLSKSHFLFCIYNHFPTFWSKPTFLNYCHIFIILCISDSKMKDHRLSWFQNKIIISKLEHYPKGIFIFHLIMSSWCVMGFYKDLIGN